MSSQALINHGRSLVKRGLVRLHLSDGDAPEADPQHASAYACGKPPNWDETVADRLRIEWQVATVSGRGTRATYYLRTITGVCPQCRGRISKDISPFSDKKTLLRLKNAASQDPYNYYYVVCNCMYQHTDAPEGATGCGAEGGIRVRRYPDELSGPGTSWEQVVEAWDLTPDQMAADQWVEQARQEELPRVRQLAQQWQTTFSAITGLVAVGSIIGADDAIHSLASPYSWIYVAAAGVALFLAVLSIIIASRAAGLRDVGDVSPDARERLGLRQAMIGYSKSRLQLSRRLALFALLLVVLSFGFRYFGPTTLTEPTKVDVVGLPSPTPSVSANP